MPNHVTKANILSKNDLARLGNIEIIPESKDVNEFIKSNRLEKIISLEDEKEKIISIHKKVKEFLGQDDLVSATLMLFSI